MSAEQTAAAASVVATTAADGCEQASTSLEAVPCMYKQRDASGNEVSMYGLILRPAGQSQNGATVIPIAPVNSSSASGAPQIQILQNGQPTTTITTATVSGDGVDADGAPKRPSSAASTSQLMGSPPLRCLRAIGTATTQPSAPTLLATSTRADGSLVAMSGAAAATSTTSAATRILTPLIGSGGKPVMVAPTSGAANSVGRILKAAVGRNPTKTRTPKAEPKPNVEEPAAPPRLRAVTPEERRSDNSASSSSPPPCIDRMSPTDCPHSQQPATSRVAPTLQRSPTSPPPRRRNSPTTTTDGGTAAVAALTAMGQQQTRTVAQQSGGVCGGAGEPPQLSPAAKPPPPPKAAEKHSELEDLSLIDVDELLSDAAAIRTEDYLGPNGAHSMDFYAHHGNPVPSTTSAHYPANFASASNSNAKSFPTTSSAGAFHPNSAAYAPAYSAANSAYPMNPNFPFPATSNGGYGRSPYAAPNGYNYPMGTPATSAYGPPASSQRSPLNAHFTSPYPMDMSPSGYGMAGPSASVAGYPPTAHRLHPQFGHHRNHTYPAIGGAPQPHWPNGRAPAQPNGQPAAAAAPNGQHVSTSPDSGIQSIDGSPPSAAPFTPPMVSPYTGQGPMYELGDAHPHCSTSSGVAASAPTAMGQPPHRQPVAAASVAVRHHPSALADDDDDADDADSDDDDFADMPTLEKFDAAAANDADLPEPFEAPLSAMSTSAPSSVPSVAPPTSRPSTSAGGERPLIAITAGMDLGEIAEQLVSQLDPEKLKQITSLIQSKTADTPASSSSAALPSSVGSCAESPAKSASPAPAFATTAIRTPTPKPQQPVGRRARRPPTRDAVAKPKSRRPAKERRLVAEAVEPAASSGDEETKSPPRRSASRRRSASPSTSGVLSADSERLERHRRARATFYKERLREVLNEVVECFGRTRLDLGPCHQRPLPWQRPDWPAVEARLHATAPAKRLAATRPRSPSSEAENDRQPAKRAKLSRQAAARVAAQSRRRGRPPLSEKPSPILHKDEEPKRANRRRSAAAAEKPQIQPPSPPPPAAMEEEKLEAPVAVATFRKRRRSRQNRDDYVKIRSNVAIDAPPRLSEPEPCNCPLENPCVTRNCPNRAANIECTQSSCEWYDECRNRRMTNNDAVHQLQMVYGGEGGRGAAVRTTTDLHAGQFICEYTGEIVRLATYERRVRQRAADLPRFGIRLTDSHVLDATHRGSIARFVNHSCAPNAELQRWLVNGHYRVGIFARRAIAEGDELTYDYADWQIRTAEQTRQRCQCGAPTCQQWIPTVRREPVVAAQPDSATSPQRLRPALNSAQLRLARRTGLLLVRNMKEKSRHRSVALCAKFPELSSLLIGIFESVAQFADGKLARKRVTQLCAVVKNLMRLRHSNEDELVQQFDAALRHWLQSLQPLVGRVADSIRQHYAQQKRARDIGREFPKVSRDVAKAFVADERKRAIAATTLITVPTTISGPKRGERVLSAEADLTYMEAGAPVGAYDPDEWGAEAVRSDDEADCVRCVCGITEEDGEMVQCDKCHFWMHADCSSFDTNADEFECEFCTRQLHRTPKADIVLKPQPEISLTGCTYYRTLVNARGVQVRINEAVYVERLINDDYKRLLKRMHDECVEPQAKKRNAGKAAKKPDAEPPSCLPSPLATQEFSRKDLRHFRVERLFTSPQGHRFVFGCYYARPHETFCDPNRLFHRNELFWTPLFDTLPLDAVVGRCLILEPNNYSEGRPKVPQFKEEDVFMCEYQIDSKQRTFTKIPTSNHYYLNTAPYVFQRFPKKRELKRDFTPFVLTTAVSTSSTKADSKTKAEPATFTAKDLGIKNLLRVCDQIRRHH